SIPLFSPGFSLPCARGCPALPMNTPAIFTSDPIVLRPGSVEIARMKGRDLMWRTAAIWALLNLATAGLPARADEKAVDGTLGLKFFEKKIRPILVEHCYSCHSDQARKLKGGLRVDGRDFLLKGGDSGPVVVPGHPEKSRLIEAISYQNPDLQMPPRGKLPDTAIADLTQWIRLGLPWPKEGEARAVTTDAGFDIERRKREHWAWQPIRV